MIKEAYSLSVDFSDFLCLIHCLVCMGSCFNMGKLKPLMFQEKFPLTPTPILYSFPLFEIFTPLIDFMKREAICLPSSAYVLSGQ